jgi:hypothetical protein
MNAEVTFILAEASARGIAIGTDGAALIMVAPLKMPRGFETGYKYKAEIIATIQRDNAGKF